MRARQKDFFDMNREIGPRRSAHGGSVGAGKRKVARPLDVKKSVHLVLKSSHAKGKMSFLSFCNRLIVERIIRSRAAQYGVVIQGFELMSNHAHLIVRFASRAMFQKFLRTTTGLIARHVTGARKGRAFGKRFFDELAFTRVVKGFRDLRGLVAYLAKNEIERDVHPLARVAIEREEAEARKLRQRQARRSKRKPSLKMVQA